MDILTLGAISEALVISGKAKHVENIEGGGSKYIALDSKPVSVAGYHLKNRLKPHQF
jgi:hypothetical protein